MKYYAVLAPGGADVLVRSFDTRDELIAWGRELPASNSKLFIFRGDRLLFTSGVRHLIEDETLYLFENPRQAGSPVEDGSLDSPDDESDYESTTKSFS